ncbi:glycosyl transferase 2 family protein [Synechococcus sp. RS9907]|uniref:glycosyltransferase n=1 Tax=Synechococcus sp. RS9907 TaxID=221350 RepID=UPI00165D7C6A|nr:glycosyltransferase [Synechococcus sp. RS9907]QNI83320.1 glycosyl transferase 2 family protein [Synechococcus sp. RS9907]
MRSSAEVSEKNFLYNLPSKSLDIIIPCFKRPHDAIVCAKSVLKQIKRYKLSHLVNVIIWDDSSPGFNPSYFVEALSVFNDLFYVGQNPANKGMSKNIFDLISSSKSVFCTILTDDDWLEDGSLLEILDEIDFISSSDDPARSLDIGAFFVPRYSYLEDGSLHCIECKPFDFDKLISSSPSNVIRYCRNAFILTGLFFRPALIDFSLWRTHIDNAFFPLFYYASISASNEVKFLDRKWFHHTCNNICHWESWGDTRFQQYSRLHSDYLKALLLIAHKYSPRNSPDSFRCIKYLWKASVHQLLSYEGPWHTQFLIVLSVSRLSLIPLFAFFRILLVRFGWFIRSKLRLLIRWL